MGWKVEMIKLMNILPPALPCPSPDTHGIEVYVDEKKQTYADLGYRRFNWLNIWTSLLSRISRAAISEVCACVCVCVCVCARAPCMCACLR